MIEAIKSVFEQYPALIVVVLLVFIGSIASFFLRLTKLAITGAILLIVFFFAASVFFGDGTSYVHQFAELLPAEDGQKLEEFYSDYREKSSELNPELDFTEKQHEIESWSKEAKDKFFGEEDVLSQSNIDLSTE